MQTGMLKITHFVVGLTAIATFSLELRPALGEEIELTGEARMLLAMLDLDDDGKLQKRELEGDAIHLLEDLDTDKDGVLTRKELAAMIGPQVDVDSRLSMVNTHVSVSRIVALPPDIHDGINRHFKKYTCVLAPNGKRIHVLAMSKWSDDRIVRARKVLEHFLRDAPHRPYGNKVELANTMADHHATLVLLNHQRDMDRVMPAIEDTNLQCQDLRANESPFEGEDDYMKHETRDAAYEEVFHLVHGSGLIFAMKPYDREIRERARDADKRRQWNYDEPNMPGNHFEYIICVYDNYLDLWKTKPTKMEGHRTGRQRKGRSFMGEYRADSRSSAQVNDPGGFDLVEAFNPDHITYTAELPSDFKGVFSISGDSGARHSDKSRHLVNVSLRGSTNGSLVGNPKDNRLVGNAGANELTGGGGDDSLFGGDGIDTAVYRGPRSQYQVEIASGLVQVRDAMVNRDGHDVLSGIEKLKFSDQVIDVSNGNSRNRS